MHALQDWILTIADAWWVHFVVLVCAWLDGFFPTAPSESVIVTLSSLWSSSGRPAIVLIALAAWAGAFAGDSTGYFIGRKIGWRRFRFLREGKGLAAVEAAQRGLDRRALLFLMTARYIPFGRTAVNIVAGAVRYPYQRFWRRDLASTGVWAIYSCVIGAVAGSWFEHNHLLAVTVALVAAVVIALIAERAVSMLHKHLDRRDADRETAAVADREAALDAEKESPTEASVLADAEALPAEKAAAGARQACGGGEETTR